MEARGRGGGSSHCRTGRRGVGGPGGCLQDLPQEMRRRYQRRRRDPGRQRRGRGRGAVVVRQRDDDVVYAVELHRGPVAEVLGRCRSRGVSRALVPEPEIGARVSICVYVRCVCIGTVHGAPGTSYRRGRMEAGSGGRCVMRLNLLSVMVVETVPGGLEERKRAQMIPGSARFGVADNQGIPGDGAMSVGTKQAVALLSSLSLQCWQLCHRQVVS